MMQERDDRVFKGILVRIMINARENVEGIL
jgi:hypothetical protein